MATNYVPVKRKIWTLEQTLPLLVLYLQRKKEFQSRKKNFFYEKILEDLIAQGVVDPSTTSLALEIRMYTLRRYYKSGKIKGRFLQLLPYLRQIFGGIHERHLNETEDAINSRDIADYKKETSNYHTLNMSGKPIKALADGFTKSVSQSQELASESVIDIKEEVHSRSASPMDVKTDAHPRSESLAIPPPLQKKKLTKEMFYAERLRIYKRKLETNIQQKQGYYNKMVEASQSQGLTSESVIDIKEEVHSRSASPMDVKPDVHPISESLATPPPLQKALPQTNQITEGIFYAERLRIYKKKIETNIQQKQDYYNKMVEASERRYRESEEAKDRRHRETIEIYTRLLSKFKKR